MFYKKTSFQLRQRSARFVRVVYWDTHDDVACLVNKVVASEGMVEMQAEVLELLQSVDTKLDYRSFLAATMEKVSKPR